MKAFKYFVGILISVFVSYMPIVSADADTDIKFIVSAQNPPYGVVFEIIENSEADLAAALKKVENYSKKLKSAIPKMKLAVVSHGTEQFALLNKNKNKHSDSHKKVQSLVSEDVPLHICGTHASWYHYTDKDFPSYVDVAVAGPAKIREYQREGYALVVIE